jgi:hypothetical protein
MAQRVPIVAIALLLAGCAAAPSNTLLTPAASPPSASQHGDSDAEVTRLKTQVTVLEEEKVYLLKREEKLSAETHYLKFTTEQQAKQIEALAETAKERDFYRRQVEKLTAQRDGLLRQIQELQGVKPTTKDRGPATRPSSTPSTP